MTKVKDIFPFTIEELVSFHMNSWYLSYRNFLFYNDFYKLLLQKKKFKSYFIKKLKSNNSEIFIYGKNRIIGFAICTKVINKVVLDAFYVENHNQYKGIGAKLFGSVVDFAKYNKCNTIEIEVINGMNACNVYLKFGSKYNGNRAVIIENRIVTLNRYVCDV